MSGAEVSVTSPLFLSVISALLPALPSDARVSVDEYPHSHTLTSCSCAPFLPSRCQYIFGKDCRRCGCCPNRCVLARSTPRHPHFLLTIPHPSRSLQSKHRSDECVIDAARSIAPRMKRSVGLTSNFSTVVAHVFSPIGTVVIL